MIAIQCQSHKGLFEFTVSLLQLIKIVLTSSENAAQHQYRWLIQQPESRFNQVILRGILTLLK